MRATSAARIPLGPALVNLTDDDSVDATTPCVVLRVRMRSTDVESTERLPDGTFASRAIRYPLALVQIPKEEEPREVAVERLASLDGHYFMGRPRRRKVRLKRRRLTPETGHKAHESDAQKAHEKPLHPGKNI